MRVAIPGIVWIGNARDARDVAAVLAIEVAAVMDLAMEEVPVQFPREIVYCRFPLMDGTGNSPAILRTVIRTLATLIETATPTLVACSGGMSRSPAVVAAALSLVTRDSPNDCLKKITATGPRDIAPALWHEICQCLKSM